MIIYETINLINNVRYIGQDSKNNPDYLGSGLLLKRAIKKYGRENFQKNIIEYCDTKEHLAIREKYWIDKSNAVKSDQYYNIAAGGNGGDCIAGLSEEKYNNLSMLRSKIMMGDKNPMYGKTHSAASILKMSHPGSENGMYGKTHSETTKKLQRDKSKDRYTLQWFIAKHGVENGPKLFKDRNIHLSKTRAGRLNPAYKHVDKNELTSLIKDPTYTLSVIAKSFKVSVPCINNKIKEYFSVSTFTEIRRILC